MTCRCSFPARCKIIGFLQGHYVEVAILFLATVLRVWALGLKPPHFDEGINGWFADQVRALGFYRYDPTNYHGPLYFYVLFLVQTLFGRSLWVLRMPAVFGSIASVYLALRFDRFFGKRAARYAALALAVSPAAVFYGRYAIHESWVMASLLLTIFGLFNLWYDGRRRSLFILIAGATLLLLLKETCFIHFVCFMLAGLCLLIWEKLISSQPAEPFAKALWSLRDLGVALAFLLGVLFFFYSGGLLNLSGFWDLFKTLPAWIHTGVGAGGHVKSDYQIGFLNYYWLALMLRYEWPSLLGLLFTVRLLWPARAMIRYLGIYGVGTLMAYSIIPYKTPWCIISLLWPFALLFGVAVEEAFSLKKLKTVSSIVATSLLIGSLVICLRLNFSHYADFHEPYVYVQTSPEIYRLTDPLISLAKKDRKNLHMKGAILLESYYPLPWMLGDFTSIGYFSKQAVPSSFDADFIVVEKSRSSEIEKKLKEPYYRQEFQLRDAMEKCEAYFKAATFRKLFEDSSFVGNKPNEIIAK